MIDRNQHLGLKDRDRDKYPDFFDHFPDDGEKYSNAMDHYEEWRKIYLKFDGSIPDSFDVWFNTLPLDHNTFNPEEIKDDPMSAIAIDIGFPIITEQNLSVAIYAQAAKLIGETKYPGIPDSTVSLGSGIIPVGIATKIGPVHFNLEYRIIPKGNFEFSYWNQTYEVERATIEGEVIKLESKSEKLPHIGWNTVYFKKKNQLNR